MTKFDKFHPANELKCNNTLRNYLLINIHQNSYLQDIRIEDDLDELKLLSLSFLKYLS